MPQRMSTTCDLFRAYVEHPGWFPACPYPRRGERLVVIRDYAGRMLITCGANENASSSFAGRCREAVARAKPASADSESPDRRVPTGPQHRPFGSPAAGQPQCRGHDPAYQCRDVDWPSNTCLRTGLGTIPGDYRGRGVLDADLRSASLEAVSSRQGSRESQPGGRTNAARGDELTRCIQYLGVLRAMASVDASRSRVGLATALLDQARALHQAGVATRVDEVRAEMKVRQEEQRLIVAQTDVDTALFALARLLNVPPGQDIQVTDTRPFSETPEIPIDATVEAAIRNRPELAAAEFRRHTAESERSAAAAESLPSLRLQGMWDEAGRSLPGMIPAYTYEARLSVPLFTSGRLRAERRRAQIGVQQAAQEEADTRNRIAQQVKTSLAEWNAAKNEVKVANDALRLAHEELDLARGRFAAGVTDNIEVISAQDSLVRANDNQIEALYRFSEARAALARALGRVEETFGRSK